MGVCYSTNEKTPSNSSSVSSTPFSTKKKSIDISSIDILHSKTTVSNYNNGKIYGIKKFGVSIKPDKIPNFPLQFIYHISKVKCKMLIQNCIYILQIIFDKKEFPLTFSTGKNPKFIFEETFGKEIKFEDLENSFLEINIYSHPLLDDPKKLTSLTKNEILNSCQKYSSLKIDLLTLSIAPEQHDIALFDLKKVHYQIGRISYHIICKHIENINCKIEKIKFNLNTLINSDLSLKLKFYHQGMINEKESKYTHFIQGNIIQKENITVYEYDNNNENILEMDNKLSLTELKNSDVNLNIYCSRLVDKNNEDDNHQNNKNENDVFVRKAETNHIFQRNTKKKFSTSTELALVNLYTLIAMAPLNFYKILNSHENQIVKRTSKFFQKMSNKKAKSTLSYSTRENLNETNNYFVPNEYYNLELFEDITESFNDYLLFKGRRIGEFEMTVSLKKIPLIKQIMCGVMTETGFEVSSIFLYDNFINNNNLPEDLLKLISLKKQLENHLTNTNQLNKNEKELNLNTLKIFNEIKNCLKQSIEDSVLYYGYSNTLDLYNGQVVMLQLGLNIFEVIDKLNLEQRKVSFEILKLLNERSEFDLGTVTSKWFKKINNPNNEISYEFKNEFLLKNKVIENFIRFNNECMSLCLEFLTRGKNNDNSSKVFTNYFLSIAYFRVPLYREIFIKSILSNINNPIIKKKITQEINVEELIEQDPINSLILWDNFYKILNSSLSNLKDENSIEINESLSDMKDIITYTNEYSRNNWKSNLSKRDFIFFNLVNNLCQFIKQEVDNETNETKIHWLNIPGFDSIIYAIEYELINKNVNKYPNSLMNLIPVFIENIDIINKFVSIIIKKTNVYDTKAIFKLINILHLIFSQKEIQNSETHFNYNLIQHAFLIIMNTENSLSIAKFIWLYYKDAHLMPSRHLVNLINTIFLPHFFNLFFHWSYQIREIFYYLLLYIFEHRIKNKMAKTIVYRRPSFIRNKINQNEINPIFSQSGTSNTSFGDLFEQNLNIIKGIENIIYTEELEPFYNEKIDENQFSNALKGIPEECRGNIVLSMQHYDIVFNEFIKWKENINNCEIYPEIDISPVKDDVVEYNTDDN